MVINEYWLCKFQAYSFWPSSITIYLTPFTLYNHLPLPPRLVASTLLSVSMSLFGLHLLLSVYFPLMSESYGSCLFPCNVFHLAWYSQDPSQKAVSHLFLFLKDFIYLLLEREEGREKERERNISVRSIDRLLLACALRGD